MKQEGFEVGGRACVKEGAEITTDNGTKAIKKLVHDQNIIIGQLLDRDGSRTLLVCWKSQDGTWCEAKAEDCTPL